MTRNSFLTNLSVILLAGAAILPLSACASYGDDYADGGYYGGSADQNLYYQNASIDDVRYSITSDMYNQGFDQTYDGNPLVFERPISGDDNIERISFWFSSDPGGVRVSVDQEYYSYGDNGWNESQAWNGPGQPFYIYGQLGFFHQQFYSHPSSYWGQRRNQDRGRDWSRRGERPQGQHGTPARGYQGNNHRPPLPTPSRNPRPRDMPHNTQGGGSHNGQQQNSHGNVPNPGNQWQNRGQNREQRQEQNQAQPAAQPQPQHQPQHQGGMNFQRQNPQNGQERHSEPQSQQPAPVRTEQHEQRQRPPTAGPQQPPQQHQMQQQPQQPQQRLQEMQQHWRERQQSPSPKPAPTPPQNP